MEANTINRDNMPLSLSSDYDRLSQYQACLIEFSNLDYTDPYLDEIRNEVRRIEAAKQAAGKV